MKLKYIPSKKINKGRGEVDDRKMKRGRVEGGERKRNNDKVKKWVSTWIVIDGRFCDFSVPYPLSVLAHLPSSIMMIYLLLL